MMNILKRTIKNEPATEKTIRGMPGGSCINCRCAKPGAWFIVSGPGEDPVMMSYARVGCPDGCHPGENLHWRGRA